MKINLLKLTISLVFFITIGITGTAQNSDDPPEIVAEGDQFYCPESTVNVVTDFSISGPSDLEISAFYIQISSGYENGDVLDLNTTGNGIVDSWDPLTGKLTISKQGSDLSYQEINDAVKNVVYTGKDSDFQGEKFFSFTLGDANFLPSTGHFYEYVRDIGITWTDARNLAEARSYYGLPGYLATITSLEEKQLSGEQAEGTGWIGGSDAEVEGTWKWVTGPEAGMIFWIGLSDGYAPNGAYEFWNTGEPNNQGNEDYAHVTAPNVGITGSWNDLSNTGASSGNYQPKGYIVEYGYGGPGDAPEFSAFTRLYTNAIDSTFSGQRCGPGIVELRATTDTIEDQPDDTDVLWFDSLQSMTPVHQGEAFFPDLNSSQDFYVLASQDGCYDGQRKIVTAIVYDIPDIIKEVTLKNCDADDIPNDGYTDFNLEEANDLINNGDLSLRITYYRTEQEASEGDPIFQIDPPYFNNIDGNHVFARAENLDGCFELAKVNLLVSATNPLDILAVLKECDYDGVNDGKFSFDLTDASVIILEGLPQQDLTIRYYKNQEDAALKINEILPQTAYTNETPLEQKLFVRIESLDNGECVSIGEYAMLVVNPLPEFEVLPELIYCQNLQPIEVAVYNAQDIYSYEWKNSAGDIISTTETAIISSGGEYSVIATSAANCVSTSRSFTVKESSIADIGQEDIEVIDGEEENSITIDPTGLGPGDYEYALDNGPYQEEPIFTNVRPGIHTVYVRDRNDCGIASIQVSVIGYPKFFTPNGDGFNDTWQVKGVSSQPESLIYIFDKFGKLLAEIEANGEGWNGVFNGKQMPSSDYWYRVQLEDGRIHTGHFSLIRR